MPENIQHYRNRCTRIEEKYQDLQDKYTRLEDRDLEHSAENEQLQMENQQIKTENKQLWTENKQLKAENRDLGQRIAIIEADKRIQNADMAALKKTISALAAKNIGIRRTKKKLSLVNPAENPAQNTAEAAEKSQTASMKNAPLTIAAAKTAALICPNHVTNTREQLRKL